MQKSQFEFGSPAAPVNVVAPDVVEHQGDVSRAAVECIHTDNPQMLNTKKRKATDDTKEGGSPPLTNIKQMKILISSATAAIFFDLPGLTEKAKCCLSNLLENETPTSFALLEACRQDHPHSSR